MVHWDFMRRVVLLAAVLAALAAGVFVWRTHTRTPRAADGPIVLISIDTLRADHLPVYGYRGVRTPAIDALAATATVFENAYSHAPQTLPAHTTILTGELPFQTGVRDNIGFTLKDGQWTLPGALRTNGWATGGFVSAYVLRAATRINQGFGTYDSELPSTSSELSLGQVQRDGALTLDAAERWLSQRTSDRVFLFVHFYEPHKPYTPPARFAEYAPYDGEIAYADELVGRLLDRLRTDRLFDRSTIVLLADHGEGLGDHGEQEHGMFLYQETMHVPLIVKLPGQHTGRRVADPVQHIDVAPTLLALVRIPKPADLHGRDLRPLLDATGTVPDTGIYAEAMLARYHFGWSELYSLTDARYRYVRAPRDELYDLQQDPREKSSIAGARPQIRQAMRGAIERLIAGTSLAAPETVSAADRDRLAALGYVGNTNATSLTTPGDSLPDPKDKAAVLERYRQGTELAGKMQFEDAIAAYRAVLAEDPEMADVWTQLAQAYTRLGRSADAVDAFRHIIERDPKDAGALTGAASELLRMKRYDEAKKHAELAVSVAPAIAHELLARIAIGQRDAATARQEARLAQQADPTLPMPDIVEGTMLYNQGQYAQCLPYLARAAQALQHRTLQVPDVNYQIGDSLARLERYPEAERFLKAEIATFPFNTRARAGLAMLYRATGRDAESEQAIAELLRVSPEGEGPALARQLWTMFGEPQKAAAIKKP
jgi:arylsulfatase A-like enzyme/lipopolysaccharide biosynthesis regulator YciM